MKISLGPVLYFWDRKTLLDFYARALETPVDIIYLGEVVCSKRRALNAADWIDLAADIARCGRQVVLSTLTLIEAESEIGYARNLVERFDGMIEANDYAVLNMARAQGRDICAGSSLNIYNSATLETLAQCGLKRWVPPLEMSGESLLSMLQNLPRDGDRPRIETEVFSYGRLPLAHSARCFTARFLNRPKDQCEFRCADYQDGIPLFSQEQQGLFQINGIQAQSFAHCNLLPYWRLLRDAGVDIMRISASSPRCLQKIAQLKNDVTGNTTGIPLAEQDTCNGYWFGEPGMVSLPAVQGNL